MIKDYTDTQLIEAFVTGNTGAYEELISRYSEKAYNLAFRITRNTEDAEEVLQDVFVNVYRKIDKFRGQSAFSSWLYRITVNTAFMQLRKRKRHSSSVSMEDLTPGAAESCQEKQNNSHITEVITTRHELKEMLESAISKLPDEYRAVFVLRDVDGLSNQQVSAITNLSVPAVKSRLHRSRLMLRKKLQGFYKDYTDNDYICYGTAKMDAASDRYSKAA